MWGCGSKVWSYVHCNIFHSLIKLVLCGVLLSSLGLGVRGLKHLAVLQIQLWGCGSKVWHQSLSGYLVFFNKSCVMWHTSVQSSPPSPGTEATCRVNPDPLLAFFGYMQHQNWSDYFSLQKLGRISPIPSSYVSVCPKSSNYLWGGCETAFRLPAEQHGCK